MDAKAQKATPMRHVSSPIHRKLRAADTGCFAIAVISPSGGLLIGPAGPPLRHQKGNRGAAADATRAATASGQIAARVRAAGILAEVYGSGD
jgi:hypothetical protein